MPIFVDIIIIALAAGQIRYLCEQLEVVGMNLVKPCHLVKETHLYWIPLAAMFKIIYYQVLKELGW